MHLLLRMPVHPCLLATVTDMTMYTVLSLPNLDSQAEERGASLLK